MIPAKSRRSNEGRIEMNQKMGYFRLFAAVTLSLCLLAAAVSCGIKVIPCPPESPVSGSETAFPEAAFPAERTRALPERASAVRETESRRTAACPTETAAPAAVPESTSPAQASAEVSSSAALLPPESEEESVPAHSHEWVPVTETVIFPEETAVVQYEAETHIVHHEAETEILHHEAETRVVFHEAETETLRVTDRKAWEEEVILEEAWDEEITEIHALCNVCGMDYHGLSEEIIQADQSGHLQRGEGSGWHTEAVTVEILHHEPLTSLVHHEEEWHTEEHVIREAWEETLTDREAWEEAVLLEEAWDEIVTDREAREEIMVIQEARTETLVAGYRCRGCGAVR